MRNFFSFTDASQNMDKNIASKSYVTKVLIHRNHVTKLLAKKFSPVKNEWMPILVVLHRLRPLKGTFGPLWPVLIRLSGQMSIGKSCQFYEFKRQSITPAIVSKMMKKRKLITEISLDNELLATSLRPCLKLEGCHALLVAIWTSCDTYNDPQEKKWKEEYWTPS